jgi:phosphatidylglycerophosphate synthase
MAKGRRYTVADVRATYSLAKAREEWFGDWASALIYRPLSIFVTPLFLAAGFSARMVTLLSLAIGLALPLIARFGGPMGGFWVAGLATVWVVLDCVDGNIARVTKSDSKSGHYFDFVTDVVFRGSFYAAIGLLADASAGGSFARLALCLLSCYVAMAARFCRLFHARHSGVDVYEEGVTQDRPRTVMQMLFSFLSGIDRILPLMVLASTLAGRFDAVVGFLVIYSGLDFLYSQISIARQLGGKAS